MAHDRPRDLPPAQRRGLYWWFLWRALVMTLCSMIAGALVGGLLGLVVGLVAAVAGMGQAELQHLGAIVGGISGLGCGLYAWWHYVAWLFQARFGAFRLRLVRDTPDVV